MKTKRYLWCYLVMVMFIGGEALACGAPAAGEDQNRYGFSFANEGADLVIKRTIDSQPREDLLDDTGYLGLKVGLAAVINGQEEKVRYERYRAEIGFIKDRIDVYLQLIRPITTPDQGQMNDKAKVIEDLGKLKQLIDQNPSTNEIYDLWNSIEQTNARFVTVTARARANTASPWGEEGALSSYALPSMKRFDPNKPRMRCISIPNVNLDLEGYMPPRRAPSRGLPESDGGGSAPAQGISG